MIVYRFAPPIYALDISGTGSRLCGGRWNPLGTGVTYTSGHISLALLEILVNTGTLDQLKAIRLVEIHIPDNAQLHEVRLAALKKGWQHDVEYTQWMGREILMNSSALVIKCPSAIIPSEYNYLINPRHADFKKIRVIQAAGFEFDERLFKRAMIPEKVN